MDKAITRRLALAGATAFGLGALAAGSSVGQTKRKLKVSAAFTDQDLRADAYKALAQSIGDIADLEFYFNNSLFKQGTELVAMQRGNLEMCNLSPFDISKQVPAWSLMTAAYLFRDVDHLNKTFKSDVGQEMTKLARDKLGIHIITPVYFGTRQVNLRSDKKVSTPADLAGVKLRMPGGEFWQFLGEAIGANPVPVAYSEVYTALQTGAIDGQDNPLVASKTMKFDEVTKQFILTNHVIAYDLMCMQAKIWDALPAEQRDRFTAAAEKAMSDYTVKFAAQEKQVAEGFKSAGLQVYSPDLEAFRAFAQKKYLESPYAKDWPKGLLERISAVR
jgi:TRAP-type C4-dicarboxylate transport system substrate-binding protein